MKPLFQKKMGFVARSETLSLNLADRFVVDRAQPEHQSRHSITWLLRGLALHISTLAFADPS